MHLRPDGPDSGPEKYFTTANADRYREAAAERGIGRARRQRAHLPLQRGAEDLGQRALARVRARRRRRLLPVRTRGHRPAPRHRGRLHPRPRGSGRELPRRARLGLRRRLDPLRRRRARSTTRTTTSGAWARAPTRSGARTSRGSGSWRAPASTTSSPTRTSSSTGGAGGRPRKATCAASTSSRWTASSESGIAIEVSTAGLRKPVGEIYPSRAFLDMCLEAGCPIALSSDAHTPEHLGFGYEEALAYLADAGVTELAVFEGRARTLRADRPARMSTVRTGHRLGLAPPRRRPAADPRRRAPGARPRPRGPLRRRRADARDHGRAARRRGPRRHRRALPRRRRTLEGRRLDRAARRASACCCPSGASAW